MSSTGGLLRGTVDFPHLVPRHINYEIYHMDSLCDNAALTNTYDVSLLNCQCTSRNAAILVMVCLFLVGYFCNLYNLTR